MRRTVGIVPCAVLSIGLLAASPSEAALIVDGSLTLNTDPTLAEIFQQTAASPCVIGGENCLNGGFAYTVEGSGGNGVTKTVSSPVYTVAQITTITQSNALTIGIDFNQSNVDQTLNSFTAIYTGGVPGSQTFDIATVLPVNNNGVGFSDFILSGFVIPVGTTHIQFVANWFNNDGPDRFFLRGAAAVPCTPADCPDLDVSEPALLALLGVGMLGAGFVRRRKQRVGAS